MAIAGALDIGSTFNKMNYEITGDNFVAMQCESLYEKRCHSSRVIGAGRLYLHLIPVEVFMHILPSRSTLYHLHCDGSGPLVEMR